MTRNELYAAIEGKLEEGRYSTRDLYEELEPLGISLLEIAAAVWTLERFGRIKEYPQGTGLLRLALAVEGDDDGR